MKRIARLFGAACLAGAAAVAHAHVFLDRAEPRVGAQLASAPAEVKLWFSEALDATACQASVTDAGGREVARSDAHVDASDRTLLRVPLPPLEPGTYTVRWRAGSADSHAVKGRFVFRVRP